MGARQFEARGSERMQLDVQGLINAIVGSVVFTVVGMIFFGISFVIIQKVTPFSIRKEIEEDQNTALGVVLGSVVLGLAIIVAAAVHG
jgi:uncharacterized membrane protein YjfL (UPF0719 family)